MWIVVGRAEVAVTACVIDADGAERARERIPAASFPDWAGERGPTARWVWGDTAAWYPALLAAGIRVERCRDLRLSHAILRDSALVDGARELRAATEWDAPMHGDEPVEATLFDLDETARGVPEGLDAALAEFRRQEAVLEVTTDAESPASAGRLLFGSFPVDFPLDLRITETAEKD